jgi:hypothetical protein
MKNLLIGMLLISCLLSSGCVVALVGAGAAGGIALSKDSAMVNLDQDFDRVWSITSKQLESMGAITLQDKKAGKIEADIQESQVTAVIKQLTAKTVSLEVKARKNLFPNVTLAQDILNQIIQKF